MYGWYFAYGKQQEEFKELSNVQRIISFLPVIIMMPYLIRDKRYCTLSDQLMSEVRRGLFGASGAARNYVLKTLVNTKL